MFTRKNAIRILGGLLVVTAGALGIDQVGDGNYPQAVVWFAIAALWAIWTVLVPSFSFGEPGKKPHPLQSVIPLATTLLLIFSQLVR